MTNALATINVHLTRYGEREEVRELANHLKRFLPNGNKMTDQDALSFSQFAIAQGLDPFAHEIWFIPGIGVVTGIAGLRKMGRSQSTFAAHARAMTGTEREEHGLEKPKEIGAVCEIFRHDTLREAVEINSAANSEVVPIKPVKGVGIWRPGDKGSPPIEIPGFGQNPFGAT